MNTPIYTAFPSKRTHFEHILVIFVSPKCVEKVFRASGNVCKSSVDRNRDIYQDIWAWLTPPSRPDLGKQGGGQPVPEICPFLDFWTSFWTISPLVNQHFRDPKSPKFSACGGLSHLGSSLTPYLDHTLADPPQLGPRFGPFSPCKSAF